MTNENLFRMVITIPDIPNPQAPEELVPKVARLMKLASGIYDGEIVRVHELQDLLCRAS